MNAVALQSFGFGEQLVRAFDREGSAWFVGKDVCGALELANSSQVISRLEDDERDEVHTVDPIGREQRTTIISESGVYALIFTSRKPAAKKFRRWVTQEVLPAIRTTGRYDVANDAGGEVSFVEPETPDEFDVLGKKLAIAREARIVFGLKAARQAWRELRLLPGLTDGMAERDARPMLPDRIAQLNRSVVDWLDARTEADPGHREPAMRLYRDYLDWAKAEDVPPPEIVTLTSFGRTLTNCGVGSMRSNCVHRIGLKLVE